MQVQPIFMFPQRGIDCVPAMQHVVYHSPNVGYWIVDDIVRDLLSEAEREQFDSMNAQSEAMDSHFGFDEFTGTPAFGCVEDALAWADAMDSMDSIANDLSAFNAPAECGYNLYRQAEEKISEIESRSVGVVPTAVLSGQMN